MSVLTGHRAGTSSTYASLSELAANHPDSRGSPDGPSPEPGGFALVDVGAVAVGQRLDEPVGPDRPRGGADLVHRRVGLAERDVVGHRAAEEVGLLGDHDDRPAKVLRMQLPQVDAVQRDPTTCAGRRTAR